MIYAGKAIRVEIVEDRFASLIFDVPDSSVNKFDQSTLGELRQALASIQSSSGLQA